MREVAPTGKFFTRPNGFDAEDHFSGRFHALKGDEHHRVELEINANKAPYFKRKEYHNSQTIVEERDDGTLRVAFDVASLDDIAAFIRSWGPGVRVVSPPGLADRIAQEAREMAEAYSA
jgi:predicted DNA-binding transcriptional regulator YafY